MARIIIITGKGGVGKSSVAAAHALKSAKDGVKTLLVSTDMAHNIADIFQKPVGGRVTPLSENLFGLEMDPDQVMQEEFPEINRSIAAMISEAGFMANKMGDDMIFPGFDDLFCLLKIGKIYQSGEFERIIVDCAPTGETLSLLKLPELLAWYMEKFFPVGKTMVRILSPISKWRYHVTLPSTEGMNDIEKMHQKLMELEKMLKDHAICSVRLVATPEKMVVEESKRNYMYLNLYGYQVDGLFINRMIPQQIDHPFFQTWKEIQGKYVEELEAVFAALPITKIPWYAQEIRGLEAIEKMVESTFSKNELFDMQVCPAQESYEIIEDKYCLLMEIPGVSLEELTITCHGLDLDIVLHNFQRRIPLPNVLRGASVEKTQIEGNQLRVFFQKKEEETPCES